MKYFIVLFFLVALQITFAQDKDVQIGSSLNPRMQSQGGYFDYSDPEAVNIKVSVWGFVKFPGKYVIPEYSSLSDLLSYAGGPTDDAHLDDLRLFRTKPDSTQELMKFDYNDLLWEDNLTKEIKNPKLQAGDMLMVAGTQRLYTRDYVTLTVSVLSALISLSILVLNIVKK
jgi:SLBB domain